MITILAIFGGVVLILAAITAFNCVCDWVEDVNDDRREARSALVELKNNKASNYFVSGLECRIAALEEKRSKK